MVTMSWMVVSFSVTSSFCVHSPLWFILLFCYKSKLLLLFLDWDSLSLFLSLILRLTSFSINHIRSPPSFLPSSLPFFVSFLILLSFSFLCPPCTFLFFHLQPFSLLSPLPRVSKWLWAAKFWSKAKNLERISRFALFYRKHSHVELLSFMHFHHFPLSRCSILLHCRVVKSIDTQISIVTNTLYSDTVLICNSIEYQSYWRSSFTNL